MASIALCCYFISQAFSTYIGGILESLPEGADKVSIAPLSAPSEGDDEQGALKMEDFQVIVERNIFNSAQTGVVEEAQTGEIGAEMLGELGPAVKSNLDIKVLGTLAIGEGTDRRSSATITGGKSKGATVYYPGEEPALAPNARLTKVMKDRSEFINGSRLEYVVLEDVAAKKTIFASAEEVHGKGSSADKGPAKEGAREEASGGGKIVINQKEIDDALGNLDKLMTEIRIVPNFKGGQPAGMKVLSVKPGSVLAKLGIKRGDILEKVNGQDLDIKTGMDLFSQMKDMKNFSLDVDRRGKKESLEYEIR
jgi:general secretion pathway protein C